MKTLNDEILNRAATSAKPAIGDAKDAPYHISVLRELSATLITRSPSRHKAIEYAIAAIEANQEGDAKDAERYRFLADPCSGVESVIFYSRGDYGSGLLSGPMLNVAIDAAIASQKGAK